MLTQAAIAFLYTLLDTATPGKMLDKGYSRYEITNSDDITFQVAARKLNGNWEIDHWFIGEE